VDPLVERINELYKKSKASGLTEEEKQEQAQLRRQYIDRVKLNLVNTLENTVFVDEDGKEIPIKKKDPNSDQEYH